MYAIRSSRENTIPTSKTVTCCDGHVATFSAQHFGFLDDWSEDGAQRRPSTFLGGGDAVIPGQDGQARARHMGPGRISVGPAELSSLHVITLDAADLARDFRFILRILL
jgi:hypothetical protein